MVRVDEQADANTKRSGRVRRAYVRQRMPRGNRFREDDDRASGERRAASAYTTVVEDWVWW